MNKLTTLLRAHINEKERHVLAEKNGRDPATRGSELMRLLGMKNSVGEQDDVLAAISPEDAIFLKHMGGSGRPDPDTGALHFEDDDGGYSSDNQDGGGADSDNNANNDSYTGDNGNTENDAPGRGLGPNEDAPMGPAPAQETDAFGNALDNAPGFSGGNGAPGGGIAGSGIGADEGLGTWDWSVGLDQQQQQEHENNVNQSISNALGYNFQNETLGDVGNHISNYFGLNQQSRADAARAAQQAENAKNGVQDMAIDENNINYAQAANFNAPGANQWGFTNEQVGKAGNEYNSLGWQGALEGNPWGYTGLDDQSHTNWGSIGRDVADVINSPVTGAIAGAAGFGLPYAVINGVLNAAKGNYTPGVNTVAGALFGPQGTVAASTLQSILNGTPGNVAAPAFAAYVNSIAPGVGDLMNVAGVTGMGARGVNDIYAAALNEIANANVDGDLSSEGVGSADAPSESVAPSGGGETALASFDAAPGGVAGGGGGPGDMSDYEALRKAFLGSKKKSRYRATNSLMALLGDNYAA